MDPGQQLRDPMWSSETWNIVGGAPDGIKNASYICFMQECCIRTEAMKTNFWNGILPNLPKYKRDAKYLGIYPNQAEIVLPWNYIFMWAVLEFGFIQWFLDSILDILAPKLS